MKNYTELEARILKALQDCLAPAPFLKAVKPTGEAGDLKGVRTDLLAEIQLRNGNKKRLALEVKPSGQPRFARAAINQLLALRSIEPQTYGVFAAPYVSPQSAGLCAENGIGYLDAAGNCQLAFDQVFIKNDGNKNIFTVKRDLRSLYSPKASRVLRAILAFGAKKSWKTQELADEAGVSLGQVANVKKLLKDREWITETKQGFAIREPLLLLTEWSQNYSYRKNIVRDFYTMSSMGEIESELASLCRKMKIEYALTGLAGAARVAPAVLYQKTMVYVETINEELTTKLGLKEVSSGSNASLLLPYDGGVFYRSREVDEIRVVSDVQLYLDLRSYKGRGEEAALAVLNQAIKRSWQ
jgi:hypothetical protein